MIKGINNKALTAALRELANEAIDIEPDGTPIMRHQKLAKLLMDMALGYTVKERNEEGNWREVYHKPVAWAIQYVFERLEGRLPMQAAVEDGTRRRASETVRELAKERLNGIAAKVVAPKGPPSYKPKSNAQ